MLEVTVTDVGQFGDCHSQHLFQGWNSASKISQPTAFLVLVTTVGGTAVPSLLPAGCCMLPNDAISYPRQKSVRFGLISNFWAFDSHSLPPPAFVNIHFKCLKSEFFFRWQSFFCLTPSGGELTSDHCMRRKTSNESQKEVFVWEWKGIPGFCWVMDVIIIVGEKDPNSCVFFSFCSQALDQKMSKSCSCQSKHCALILGHAGRTVANLGIGELAAAPLNSIKSSSYLLLPINEWIYYGGEGRAGSQGWQQVRSGVFGWPERCHPQPHCSLSQPQAAASSPALGCCPLGTAHCSPQSVSFDMQNNAAAIKCLPPAHRGLGSGSTCISYLPPTTLKGLFLNGIWISQSGISFFWDFQK